MVELEFFYLFIIVGKKMVFAWFLEETKCLPS